MRQRTTVTSRHRGRRASLPTHGPGRKAGPARGTHRSPREQQQKTLHPLRAGRKAPLPTGQARLYGTQAAMPRHASVPIACILSNPAAGYVLLDPSRMYGMRRDVLVMVSRCTWTHKLLGCARCLTDSHFGVRIKDMHVRGHGGDPHLVANARAQGWCRTCTQRRNISTLQQGLAVRGADA